MFVLSRSPLMMTADQSREVQEAIARQERAHATVVAALRDETFMADVMDSREREAAGERGELLTDVIKRLKLV
jgi:hypothetical protein